MDVDEIVAVISAGMCRGDKVAECSTCQRKLRAIEAVRAMGAVAEAARLACGTDPYGAAHHHYALERALDALDAAEVDRG